MNPLNCTTNTPAPKGGVAAATVPCSTPATITAVRVLRDLRLQLEGIGIYAPGEGDGQWAGTKGLSFASAESAARTGPEE